MNVAIAEALCSHPGCKDAATRRPTIQVPARPPHNVNLRLPDAPAKGDGLFDQGIDGPTRYVVEYEIVLSFCDHHAGLFQWRKFVDEACWSAIENQLAQVGLAPPDKDHVTVRWEEAACGSGLSREQEEYRLLRHGGVGPEGHGYASWANRMRKGEV
jgi:hypothetical protein